MKDFNADMELIEKYVDGSLSGEEKSRAEKLLNENLQLQQEYDYMMLAINSVKHSGLQEQVASVAKQYELKEVDSTPVKSIAKVRSINFYMMRVAAAVVLIIASYSAILYTTATPDQLFSEGFISYDLPSSRSASAVNIIEQQYKDADWQKVLTSLQNQPDISQKEMFLGGMAALQLNNADAARSFFQKVLDKNQTSSEILYQEDAQFYLALTYIKLHDFTKAYDMLQMINANPDHAYYNQVKQMNLLKARILKWKN